jgi:UDP-N-acetyl-D-mannosaminuronic acid dehydrogenase
MSELDNFPDRHVAIMGLGYVGLTLAVSMADIGFRVIGVEIRDEVLKMLRRGEAHFQEPGLRERLRRVIKSGHLVCQKRIPEQWNGRVFFITVGTPLDEKGRSRLDMVEGVSREVAGKMNDGALVIMRSTVKLGVTRKVVTPILDASGKKYDLAFCPERTLEGRALVELRQLPQIVGGLNIHSAVRAAQLFQFITPTVVRVSDIETAEMIKLVDNAQRDVAFGYANEVARACDALGVSAAEVIQAGKLGYPRTNLPMPGPVGGPCLEKDPHILAEGLRELGLEPEITMAARRVNENQPAEVVDHIGRTLSGLPGLSATPVITLLGLAFKGQPSTDDLRGTMARPVLARLREVFPSAKFRGYDAVVSNNNILDLGLVPVDTLEDGFESSSLIMILNNHQTFISMQIHDLAASMARPGLIYDFWNCFRTADLRLPKGIVYMALGSHGLASF